MFDLNTLALIQSEAIWGVYAAQVRQHCQTQLGIPCPLPSTVKPLRYPCLTAAKQDPHTGSVAYCFIYMEDALTLLQAGGAVVEFDASRPAPARSAAIEASSLKENFRMSAAHDMAIISLMIRTGICTEAKYEEEFTRCLAAIDRIDSENQSGFEEQLRDGAKPLLERLRHIDD